MSETGVVDEKQEPGLDAAERFRGLFERIRDTQRIELERKRVEILSRPPVDPNDVLVRDPETGERRTFSAVTIHQEHHIRFRVMTRGDLLRVPEDVRHTDEKVTAAHWPEDVKAEILRSCLVEPDLVGLCAGRGEEFTAEWLAEWTAWPVVDDYVECIYRHSQPRLLSPPFEEEEKRGSGDRAAPSPNGSASDGSTSSDTGTSTARSTD